MQRIAVVGVGPGSPEFLTPLARRFIEEAEVLVGGQRHLEQFAHEGQERYEIRNNLPSVVGFIRSRMGKKIVVMTSGDPGLYGILSFLKRHFDRDELEVVPGVSSVQAACAKLALPWQDAVVVSIHGRNPDTALEVIKNNRKIVVLTSPKATPAFLAEKMESEGILDRKIFCCCDIGYPEEKVVEFSSPTELKEHGKLSINCVMVIVDE